MTDAERGFRSGFVHGKHMPFSAKNGRLFLYDTSREAAQRLAMAGLSGLENDCSKRDIACRRIRARRADHFNVCGLDIRGRVGYNDHLT